MTTLLLVRHGETEDNVNQIMQGQTQGRLTENGILQAQRLAEELANHHKEMALKYANKRIDIEEL